MRRARGTAGARSARAAREAAGMAFSSRMVPMTPILVDYDVPLADEPAPLLALGPDVPGELLRRAADGVRALLGELCSHLGRGEDRRSLFVYLLDYFLRCAGRSGDPAPRQRLVARHPRFGDGWQLRHRRRALEAGDRYESLSWSGI